MKTLVTQNHRDLQISIFDNKDQLESVLELEIDIILSTAHPDSLHV